MKRERNTIEERLNSTKPLDELDDLSRLKKLNEQDQAIIDDVYVLEFNKEAARERCRLEMKSFRGCKLRYRKENLPCLSEKGSSISSKNMV